MKIISSNAAPLLFEKVETLGQEGHRSWRCIYMRLSDKQERFNRQLRTHFINRALAGLLARDEGNIYFCDDGDIFILFEGALKPMVEKLGGHFGDLDPAQLRGQAENTLFTFFDLDRHWQGFYQVCRAKAHRILPARDRLAHTPIVPELPAEHLAHA